MTLHWRIISFVLFIVGLALLYIANSYSFRARIREYTKTRDSLLFIETYYYHLLSQYVYKTSPQLIDTLLAKKGISLVSGESNPLILEIKNEE